MILIWWRSGSAPPPPPKKTTGSGGPKPQKRRYVLDVDHRTDAPPPEVQDPNVPPAIHDRPIELDERLAAELVEKKLGPGKFKFPPLPPVEAPKSEQPKRRVRVRRLPDIPAAPVPAPEPEPEPLSEAEAQDVVEILEALGVLDMLFEWGYWNDRP